MKEEKAPVNIINFDKGIASERLNCKEKRRIGKRRPPPPIPPAFENADPIRIRIDPIISIPVGG